MTFEEWKREVPHCVREKERLFNEIEKYVQSVASKELLDGRYRDTNMRVWWGEDNNICVGKANNPLCHLELYVEGFSGDYKELVSDTYHTLLGLLIIFDDLARDVHGYED